MPCVLALALVPVLIAPSSAQDNAYRIRETVWASQFGTVVMAGTERRKIGAPAKGTRPVQITFEVSIVTKGYSSAAAERWAQRELRDLRVPDKGSMDDADRFIESEGVAADAFPIYPKQSVAPGDKWDVTVNGYPCSYRLESIGDGKAVILTESSLKQGRDTAARRGSWTIELATGRLLKWKFHNEATYADGTKESVDSIGELST